MKYYRSLLLLMVPLFVVGCGTPEPDYTKGRPETCEVHQVTMSRTSVPIMYGLPDFNEQTTARAKASGTHFPHAGNPPEGGCLVDPKNPKRATVFVCAECQGAARDWNVAYDSQH